MGLMGSIHYKEFDRSIDSDLCWFYLNNFKIDGPKINQQKILDDPTETEKTLLRDFNVSSDYVSSFLNLI